MAKKEYSPKLFTSDIAKFLKNKFPDEWKELQNLTKNWYVTPWPPYKQTPPSKTYRQASRETSLSCHIGGEELLEEIGKANVPLDMIEFVTTCSSQYGDCESNLKMIIYEEVPNPLYEKALKDHEARLVIYEKEVEKYEVALCLRKEKATRAIEIEKLFEAELKARLK